MGVLPFHLLLVAAGGRVRYLSKTALHALTDTPLDRSGLGVDLVDRPVHEPLRHVVHHQRAVWPGNHDRQDYCVPGANDDLHPARGV